MKLDYCGNIVRQYDPDRFLLSLLCPARRRPALWALFAFNHEIAKTREVVRETRTGLIRLQWWREAVDTIYGGDPPEHAVVRALAQAVQAYGLPREALDALIYAREFDLEDRRPADMGGFIRYADFTTTPLNQLVLHVLGQAVAEEELRAVSVRYAAAGLLRAVPFYLRQRRCVLPDDVMDKHGVSLSALYDWGQTGKLSTVVVDILNSLYTYHKTSNMFLNASDWLSELYFRQIKQCGYDLFDKRMLVPPPFKAFRIWVGRF